MACGRRHGFDTALRVGIAIPAFNLRRHSVHQALVDGHDLVGLEGLSGSVPLCGDTVGHIPQFVAVIDEQRIAAARDAGEGSALRSPPPSGTVSLRAGSQ